MESEGHRTEVRPRDQLDAEFSRHIEFVNMMMKSIGKAQGRCESLAYAIDLVLANRSIPIPAEVRERINDASVIQLEEWMRRSVTAERVEDLFDEDRDPEG